MKKIGLSLLVIASSGAYVWAQAGKLPANDLIDMPADIARQDIGPTAPVRNDPVSARAAVPASVPEQGLANQAMPRKPLEVGRGKSVATAVSRPDPTVANGPQQILPPPSPPKQAAKAPSADPTPPRAPTFAATPAIYIPVPRPRPTYPQPTARIIKAGMKAGGGAYSDGVYTGPPADAYYGTIQIQALVQGGRLTALKVLQYPNDRRTSVNINRQALPMLRDEAISAQSADVDIISGATLTSNAFIQSLGGALRRASS